METKSTETAATTTTTTATTAAPAACAYLRAAEPPAIVDAQRRAIAAYADAHRLRVDRWVEWSANFVRSPESFRALDAQLPPGATVLVASLIHLGPCPSTVLDALILLLARGRTVRVADGNLTLRHGAPLPLPDALRVAAEITRVEALQRRAAPPELRRGLGIRRGPKAHIHHTETTRLLQRSEQTIRARLAEGHSSPAIARELGVSRGTLYNYIRAYITPPAPPTPRDGGPAPEPYGPRTPRRRNGCPGDGER